MPKLGYYVIGDYNATCDQCGRGFKFSSLRLRWDSAWVDSACWEPRQPQDFQHDIKDDSSVPIARPRILPPSVDNSLLWTDGAPYVVWTNSPFILEWTN